ncbi:unnamed protein product [Coffea canephora]|uniref:Uncharacterized protein n=1 Tax=Coffea canephora TaxID=49390 RepID=A0A068UMD7_COFCA|nr:unnamed protein product [Coffea canephora]
MTVMKRRAAACTQKKCIPVKMANSRDSLLVLSVGVVGIGLGMGIVVGFLMCSYHAATRSFRRRFF